MESFESLLKKFDTILQKDNNVNYKRLQSPLSEKEIDRYLRELKIEDESFKQLYIWKNGFNSTYGENRRNQIFDFGALLSLEHLFKSKILDLKTWKVKFIPLIGNGDGDYILFNNDKGLEYGKLHLYSVSLLFIEEPISYYDSIYKLIETTIEAYEKNAFKYDDKENWLEIDNNKFNKIASATNKNSEYWNANK